MDAVNLYICYKLDQWLRDLDTDFRLGSCLFASVMLTKNADQINTNTAATIYDLILVQNLHGLMEAMGQMLLYSELICAHLYMLMVREKIS